MISIEDILFLQKESFPKLNHSNLHLQLPFLDSSKKPSPSYPKKKVVETETVDTCDYEDIYTSPIPQRARRTRRNLPR